MASSSSPTTSAASLLDEFQAFVARVKQLHMSRSADDTVLSHEKASRKMAAANEERAALAAKSLDQSQPALLRPATELPSAGSTAISSVEMPEEDAQRRANVIHNAADKELQRTKNIRVTVGIDEDLKMILEMDPEIVDLGDTTYTSASPKILGLPPLSGG